jgi:phage FluMu protein Com
MPHEYKCKKCNKEWIARIPFDHGIVFCPTCKTGLPIRGRNNKSTELPKASFLPVVVQPEAQKQSDIYMRFWDII